MTVADVPDLPPPRQEQSTRLHGFRLPTPLSHALTKVAEEQGVGISTVVIRWLMERAKAEGRL